MNMVKSSNANKNCIIYCRVSSAKQAQQGESLDDQEKVCRATADRLGLTVLKVFREQFSGRQNDRPVITEVFEYIEKSPKDIGTLIVRGIDRLSRGGTLGYDTLKQKLSKNGVAVIDGHGVIQQSQNTLEHLGVEYPWSKTSPSEITELVLAQQSKKEVSDILTRTIGAEIGLVRDGYKVRRATDGFVNKTVTVDGKRKVVEIPDPERMAYFLKMFDMRISGTHTDQQIVDTINAMGYRSKAQYKWSKNKERIVGSTGGIPLNVKQFQKIIQRPAYCGVNNEKWLSAPIKTKYNGLVSIEKFNQANRGKVFIEESKDNKITIRKDFSLLQLKRSRNNPLFPYKEVMHCPLCNKQFMGSSPKGKSGKTFPTYHCNRDHKYYGISKGDFEKTISEFLGKLKHNDEFLGGLKVTLMNKYREKEKELGEFSVKANINVAELEAEKVNTIKAFVGTQNEIIRAELEKQITDLQGKITQAQEERNEIEVSEHDIHAFTLYAKKVMEHPKETLMNQKETPNIKALFSLVFDDIPTYTELVNRTPKLSLLFNISETIKTPQEQLGCLASLEWNTVENMILKWNRVFANLSPVVLTPQISLTP